MIADLGAAIKDAISPSVRAARQDLRNTTSSLYQSRNKPGTVPLARSFTSSIQMDPDGFGFVKFRTLRHAYILNYGHDAIEVKRKGKTYKKGRLVGSGFIDQVQERHISNIAEAAAKVSADVAVQNILK